VNTPAIFLSVFLGAYVIILLTMHLCSAIRHQNREGVVAFDHSPIILRLGIGLGIIAVVNHYL